MNKLIVSGMDSVVKLIYSPDFEHPEDIVKITGMCSNQEMFTSGPIQIVISGMDCKVYIDERINFSSSISGMDNRIIRTHNKTRKPVKYDKKPVNIKQSSSVKVVESVKPKIREQPTPKEMETWTNEEYSRYIDSDGTDIPFREPPVPKEPFMSMVIRKAKSIPKGVLYTIGSLGAGALLYIIVKLLGA